ncbi:MAG: hypothetical protein QOH17_3158 [Pseudonocardiales bacterium]|nr:hypothetical protein [Pseudonocardiales bacterium]
MNDRSHRTTPYRIALIDRPWLGYRSVMLATPLVAPPIERIRAVLAEFLVRHPTAPLACRIDAAERRWVPVPPVEHAAHLDRILRSAPDPEPDDLGGHVRAHRDAGIEDLPFVATVSPGSVMLNGAHVLGDAATLSRLLQALAGADADGLAAISDRARTVEPVRALARGLRAHGRDWFHHLRSPSTPPTPTQDAPPSAGPARPAFVGTVLDQNALRGLTRWRNANAKGVSLTSVLTTAAFRALTAHGVAVHGGGFYALIDIRAGLPDAGLRFGNLAKSLYLSADLREPSAAAAALSSATQTQRALPAIVVASATSLLARRGRAPVPSAATPAMLTFNSLPSLPGVADLPWSSTTGRRFYGFGESVGPGSITIFALRMRDHMELTASFDESSATPAAVQAALDAIACGEALSGALATVTRAPGAA